MYLHLEYMWIKILIKKIQSTEKKYFLQISIIIY